jgi:hypothetical protein
MEVKLTGRKDPIRAHGDEIATAQRKPPHHAEDDTYS